MEIWNQLLQGFVTAGTPVNLLWAFVGCALGTAVGVLHLQTALLHWISSADPDTNRSAGLHSWTVVLPKQCHRGLLEFACCRSDLFKSIFSLRLRKKQH